MDLREMQDWIVARQLYGIAGVAEVTAFGGISKQYEVAVNPARLKAMNVTIPEIFEALEKNNQNTGGAYIDKKPNAYFIRGVGLVNSITDIENTLVKKQPNGIPVIIRDVATGAAWFTATLWRNDIQRRKRSGRWNCINAKRCKQCRGS